MTGDAFNAGALLRAAREAAGLSQEDLARRVTMHPSNLAKHEKQRVITTATLEKIARGLGLEVRLVPRERSSDSYGTRLHARRRAAGLTTGELARALGVRPAVVAGWELDVNEPSEAEKGAIDGALLPLIRDLVVGEPFRALDEQAATAPTAIHEADPTVAGDRPPPTDREPLPIDDAPEWPPIFGAAPEPEPFRCDCGAGVDKLEPIDGHYRCAACGAEWGERDG